MENINWGIVGLGEIAHIFSKGFEESSNAKLLAVASKDTEKLNKFSDQFNISSNVMTAVIEKKLNYSITKKVEQVEVYREKYELVEFLWEKILSSESEINDNEMTLIRKWVRRLDISDVESEGARKEVEANLNP